MLAQGRQATVFARDQPIGEFGIIHPEVTPCLGCHCRIACQTCYMFSSNSLEYVRYAPHKVSLLHEQRHLTRSVHRQVLAAFDIPFPVAAMEINLEPFVFDQGYRPLPTHMAELQLA